jgi:hypothetical protein
MEMVDLDRLLPSTHPYRGFQAYLPDATKALAEVSQLKGADGYGVEHPLKIQKWSSSLFARIGSISYCTKTWGFLGV